MKTRLLLAAAVAFACFLPHTADAQQLPTIPWPQGWPSPFPPAAPTAPPPGGQPAAGPRAMLPPLLGAPAMQQEVRLIINELISNLGPEYAARVRNIPLVVDPNQGDVNAFAGCDEHGNPFLAYTEGMLDALDAVSQTVANDDLYGTHTYDQYSAAVMPRLAQGKGTGATAALPLGILPLQTALDPRRLSRAHELFDELAAFTFGHELAHHYLNHTGCANGQAASGGPNPAVIFNQAARYVPIMNQPFEIAADSQGCINVLDSGRARGPRGVYVWTERGGLTMLDFFYRLERAAGVSALNPIGYVQSHPAPSIRIPIVRAVAQTWHYQHPG